MNKCTMLQSGVDRAIEIRPERAAANSRSTQSAATFIATAQIPTGCHNPVGMVTIAIHREEKSRKEITATSNGRGLNLLAVAI